MPHNLTEADVFTTPISVPDGLDSRNTAADVVDAIAQALANRTNNLNLHAARTNIVNTFVHSQFVDPVDNEEPMIGSTLTSVVSGFPDSAWRLFAEFPVLGPVRVRMYFGQNDSDAEGAFCITVNALYSTNTADSWYADDFNQPSYAAFVHQTQLRTAVKLNTDPHWNWLLKGAIDVGAISGIAMQLDSVSAEYNYKVGRVVSDHTVPMGDCYGEIILQADGSVKIGPGITAAWRLRLPHGVTLSEMDVMVNQASASGALVQLVRRDKGVFGGGITEPAGWGSPIDAATGPSSSGLKGIALVGTAGHVIDNAYEYSIQVTRAHVDDRVCRLRVRQWTNPGPRNYT